ncbi:MAG: endoribonuclease [Devosia sp.]|uniref:RidA family protein n=1 Tax=Devosia sp. TaxID=1871048 RepID=UPI00262A5C27|nr:RidA family protein [Devosia sp.]MDB5538835.1 endoribonuclease [Devosia sp.]
MRIAYGSFPGLPLTPAIGTEEFVFVTGQVGSGPDGSYPASIEEQTRVALQKLGALLEQAGSSYDRVVKTTVFLTDVREFPAMNRVYAEFFPNEPPARSTIGCQLVDVGARVEIEAIALR